MAVSSREAVIYYEFLQVWQNETVVKELCVASAIASETFRFKPPYKKANHGAIDNGINWMDVHTEYKKLHTVLNEAVAGFAHLYAYVISKCTSLVGLTGRPIHNLHDINSITSTGVLCPATDFSNKLAQQKPRIPSTNVWYTICRRRISSNALLI